MNITIAFCVFELVWIPNFTLKGFEFWNQICPKKVFSVQNEKSEHHHWILHIRITKFQLKLTILIFWTKLAKKGYFQSKWEKVSTAKEFQFIFGTKFQLELKILTFWTKFAQKGYFWSQTKEVNITIEFYTIELVQVPTFNLKW